MYKQAITVDPATVGRYALGGLITGGALASTLNLAHMIHQMRESRRKQLKPMETDENTIVLTLPPKAADAVATNYQSTGTDESKIKKMAPHGFKDVLVNGGPGKQGRDKNKGTFDEIFKLAEATGWQTLTASTLAALVGGTTGAALVNKMYEVQREKRLKAELDAAKQEYMNLLSGGSVKGAEKVEELFPYIGDLEKQADSAFGLLNYPMAAMALLTILGTGGAAYLTKKILDEKLRASETQGTEGAKVKRIVIRSSPEAGFKQASQQDRETIAGGLMVMMDVVGHSDRFLGHPTVKQAMAETKMARVDVTGTGSEGNWDTLMQSLESNPKLRRALYGLYIDYTTKGAIPRSAKHIGMAIPGVSRLADNKLYETMAKMRYNVPPGGASGVKLGQDMSTMALINSMLGKNPKVDEETLAKAIVDAQEAAAETKRTENTKVKDKIRVEASDPKAVQYMANNKGNIDRLIKRLAAEGQI